MRDYPGNGDEDCLQTDTTEPRTGNNGARHSHELARFPSKRSSSGQVATEGQPHDVPFHGLHLVETTQSHAHSLTGEPLESAESRITTSPPVSVPEEFSELATNLYITAYLVFFSIFGTLARVGLQALTFYPGAPVVTGVLWANVGGSLLMGLFAEDKKLFREEWGQIRKGESSTTTAQSDEDEVHPEEFLRKHQGVKKGIPLYIGLTTGFCGCFTSFSTFMLDAFFALSNDLANPNSSSIVPRHGGYSFMAVVAVLLYTVSLSLSALIFGAHLARTLPQFIPTLPFRVMRKVLDPTFVLLGFGCWLGAVFLAIWPPDRHMGGAESWRGRAVLAIVFAPLGCLLRFYASIHLNPRVSTFPLGTFVANMFGTLVLGMCFDLQHSQRVASQLIGCQVLQGVVDGFCGSLTTVSTWVAELYSLDILPGYRYGVTSLGLGLVFLVVIVGSLRWTEGLTTPVC